MAILMPRLAVLLALFALCLASLGPVLDHHFAERQPGHTHLYLGAQVPGHLHPYQQAHTHHQAEAEPSRSDDTVYLTTHDGIGLDWSTAASPWVDAASVFPNDDDGPLQVAQGVQSRLSEAVVSPLERPPLA
jgi:hypothetical protein